MGLKEKVVWWLVGRDFHTRKDFTWKGGNFWEKGLKEGWVFLGKGRGKREENGKELGSRKRGKEG